MTGRAIEDFQVRVLGAGKRTVVLGNGFGTGQSVWRPLAERLAASGCRVISYDSAGTTPATLPLYQAERHASLYGFAEDLISVMQALDVRHAAYVGHSVGGIVGLLAANGTPDLFASLSFLGSSACYLDDPATGYIGGFSRRQIEDLLAAMRGDYAAWANGFASMVIANPERPHLAVEFCRSLLALRPDIASAMLETIFLADHRKDAAGAALPVQVLQTQRDPAVPLAAARWLAEACHAADFRIIEGEGHFPHLSSPERIYTALSEFFACHA